MGFTISMLVLAQTIFFDFVATYLVLHHFKKEEF